MLPFDSRPWAKCFASIVITVSLVSAVAATYVLYVMKELHIPEITIIFLLLLTIVPPNVEIILRKRKPASEPDGLSVQQLHTR